jgi:hypothetical protein
MPPGEEMFKYHGYSCDCPKPPLPEDLIAMARAAMHDERLSDGALYGKLADEIERLRALIGNER